MVLAMIARSGRRSIGCAVLMVGLVAWSACKRQEATAEPERAVDDCNPADDCNDMFGGATVRQHSPQAASFAELSHGCPYAPEEVPELESLEDGSVPELNRRRSRRSNMHKGNEFPQDIDLHAHMLGMQGDLFACVDLAACYEDGAELTGQGELDFDFELHPDGHVVAVSVKPTEGLDHPSVIACARKTLARYRFPQYDGGQMFINYTVTIETVPGDG
jgi:hypothetical protein